MHYDQLKPKKWAH